MEEKIEELRVLIDLLTKECEILRHELDIAKSHKDEVVKLLIGIHALLYPSPIVTGDGRTMVFRPKNIDPHMVLQELSDRIRALPEKLANTP
ncbi:MAG: hypothetical protein IPK44_00955 [Candidatus Accumulibacter sp.]|uniref:hypothetical protein n=1 Tax=Accumulibacter sp. TaxID=2053492 RepID=UPI00258C5080|nr:hypothetical protein [Accumulibacter sp.]MBK8113166.1 hypothetical protein [Accumulibacter sp.]